MIAVSAQQSTTEHQHHKIDDLTPLSMANHSLLFYIYKINCIGTKTVTVKHFSEISDYCCH